VFLAGLATVLRGPGWPVMSARYEPPQRQDSGAAGPGGADRPAAPAAAARARDSASMWESLSGGEDPTEGDEPADREDRASVD
jgi:hypothetical protein